MTLKKLDFIEIDYTGRLEDGAVFDTTNEEIAKQNGLYQENAKFSSVVICIGENHVLKGIDEFLIGKTEGEYTLKLPPEKAFGKKNPKLLKLIPLKVFTKQKIRPIPGLEVNIDNMYGIVRTVSGGRCIVDFNHPLSGHNIEYKLKVGKVVTDTVKKAESIFRNELHITDSNLEVKDKTLFVDEKIPKDVLSELKKRVLKLIPDLSDVAVKKVETKKSESDIPDIS